MQANDFNPISIVHKFLQRIDLHPGEEEKEKVLENVKSSVAFKGSNLWILACAIVIASIGLNMNSTAVIIGAMLISPLMGPIVGAGFSLAIFDFPLLKKSLKNLLIATLVSLIVAAIYFYFSPFKDTQSELLARTSPTIYDVLIAFFGGLVGVIAITRVEKGNPIPGVAIATALMPPLCTAGYGIAIGNLNYFLGALFLYSINCVFICIATYFMVKYLKYQPSKHIEERFAKQVKYSISTLVLIMILPSIYFAYNLLQENRFNQSVNNFVASEFSSKGVTVIYKNVEHKKQPYVLELAFLNKKLDSSEIKKYQNRLKNYKVYDTKLIVRQDTTDIRKFIQDQLNDDRKLGNEKDLKIAQLEKQILDNRYDNSALFGEAKILFPEIHNISAANHNYYAGTDSALVRPVILYELDQPLNDSSKVRLEKWLRVKITRADLVIIGKTPNIFD